MNDCMWTVFHTGEEDGTSKRILVNQQIHKTQSINEAVQARLQDFTNVAPEFYGISLW